MWWQVQRYLGVCPQHDVLWETMTCEEHLKLFAGFKGVPNEVLLLGQFGFRGWEKCHAQFFRMEEQQFSGESCYSQANAGRNQESLSLAAAICRCFIASSVCRQSLERSRTCWIVWVLKRQGRVGMGKSAMDEKECTERLWKTYNYSLCKLMQTVFQDPFRSFSESFLTYHIWYPACARPVLAKRKQDVWAVEWSESWA